jgi:hypothetical protein
MKWNEMTTTTENDVDVVYLRKDIIIVIVWFFRESMRI